MGWFKGAEKIYAAEIDQLKEDTAWKLFIRQKSGYLITKNSALKVKQANIKLNWNIGTLGELIIENKITNIDQPIIKKTKNKHKQQQINH